jgi:hypothetical protein
VETVAAGRAAHQGSGDLMGNWIRFFGRLAFTLVLVVQFALIAPWVIAALTFATIRRGERESDLEV